MRYLDFLRSVHRQLQPKTYLEIGVRQGVSLGISSCRSVGIDPAYNIVAQLDGDFALFRTTSDEYFARPDPLAATGGRPFELAFIDGLHLFEFALRDFIYTERHSSARSVVVFDDVMPRTVDEAARQRHTHAWTGDVYGVLEVLARYRPDLSVIPVGTQPTGLLIVVGLDPSNTVLSDNWDAIMAEFRHPDPQPVPAELMDRRTVLPPQRVLESSMWQVLADASEDVAAVDIREQLAESLRTSLGLAYTSPSQLRSGLEIPPDPTRRQSTFAPGG